MRTLLLVVLVMCLPACQSTLDTYTCTSDEGCQSNDVSGRCQASQHCSFSDGLCPSGQRYDDLAGEQSNACVEDSPATDAGAFDAGGCDWDVGFDILNVGSCTQGAGPALYLVAGGEPGYSLDTMTGELSLGDALETTVGAVVAQSDGSELFVVATEEFYISAGATLVVTGSRPLAIVATGLIQIEGSLGVSANGATSGPTAQCDTGNGQEHQGTGGGGGGGGFVTLGGHGGVPDFDDEWALGGAIAQDNDLVPLRGGCRGGKGQGSLGASGGAGGAIQLVSGTSITVLGVVEAAGGGGGGGTGIGEQGGGGGGGSGGAILFQAPLIDSDGGVLSVVGGGGGGGGGFTHGEPGRVITGGVGGTSLMPGIGPGGRGGDAAFGDAMGGFGANTITELDLPAGGGGGGGGGYGRIRIVTGQDESPDG